ncbi:MAG: response regulator transcription factor [Elusimicrobia bacterium]|nr:response regulator transcription factor [Elusimicrobiota bacterium]
MKEKIKIAIVDDHPILRSGLKMLLSDYKDINVVSEAGSGKEILQKLNLNSNIDIILLDINLPDINGLLLVNEIRKINNNIKILILTMYDNESYLNEFLRNGVSGYITKKSADIELIKAIYEVNEGRTFIDNILSRSRIKAHGEEKKLSEREKEVVNLVVKGLTNKEISTKLNISIKTVETYRLRITNKLKIYNKGELLKYAIKEGMFNPLE